MIREIKGWHVFAAFALAFSVIIAVNLTLAFNAVRTFPGLEVKNSYVASQAFDREKTAQLDLNWDVSATLRGDTLTLRILQDGQAISPVIESATFGRATNVQQDQAPEFVFDGKELKAVVQGGRGNWNLRLRARSADGTLFQQRVIVRPLSCRWLAQPVMQHRWPKRLPAARRCSFPCPPCIARRVSARSNAGWAALSVFRACA